MGNTALDLEAIEARCEAATKGPWVRADGPTSYDYATIVDVNGLLVTHVNKQHNARDNNIDFIMHTRSDIPALLATVKQLQRELHDERVRRYEWEKLNNRLIAGTEVERLQERLGQVKIALDHEVDSRVRAELEVERLQIELAQARDGLAYAQQAAQEQSDEIQEFWLSPCEAEGLRRQLARCNEEHDQLVDRTDDAMSQIHKYDEHLAENLIQYAVEDVLERLVTAEQRAEVLAALVTPELAELMERLGRPWNVTLTTRTKNDRMSARTFAARIREALEKTE